MLEVLSHTASMPSKMSTPHTAMECWRAAVSPAPGAVQGSPVALGTVQGLGSAPQSPCWVQPTIVLFLYFKSCFPPSLLLLQRLNKGHLKEAAPGAVTHTDKC